MRRGYLPIALILVVLAALPLVVAALLIAHPRPAGAESDEYQSPEDFVRTAFPDADPAARARYDELYGIYEGLYERLKPVYAGLDRFLGAGA